MHGFLFCDSLPSCFLGPKVKLESDFFFVCIILILSFIFKHLVIRSSGKSGQMGKPNSYLLFLFLFFFERVWGQGGLRERERKNPMQVLCPGWSLAWGSIP